MKNTRETNPHARGQSAAGHPNARFSTQIHRRNFLLGLSLFGLVLWVFFAAVQNDFVNYDDPEYVTNNAQVQQGLTWHAIGYAFTSTDAANWHPATWFSHILDFQFFGPGAWGHHLTSVLLHAINAVLVFLVLKSMTGAPWRSLMLAALFALHPLRVESVAWVAERKDVLSALFFLLTLWAWARYAAEDSARRKIQPTAARSTPDARRFYVLALLFYAAGLMSKPMLVTLPFVLLLLDFWPLHRFSDSNSGPSAAETKTPNSRLLWEKIPFFVLAAAASVVTFVVQRGSGAVITNLSFAARVENAAVSYCRYLGKTLWPHGLSVFYPYPPYWPAGSVPGAILLLAAITGLALIWKAKRPYILVGWLWFLGTLVPVIGLVQVGEQSMADRYSYIPSLGIGLILIWGAFDLTGSWPGQRKATIPIFAATVLGCIVLTRHQLGFWVDSETLFTHATQVTRGNYLAHNSLGTALGQEGRFGEAIEQFQEALAEKPGYYFARCNLGTTFDKQGRLDDAVAQLREAIRQWPAYYTAHCNLGSVLQKQGRLEDAAREFQEALKEKPRYAEAHLGLGIVLSQRGQLPEAARQIQAALLDRPNYAEAHYAWGAVLDKAGKPEEAIQHYLAAARLKPNDPQAHYTLGGAWARVGQLEDAIREFQLAIELRPEPDGYNDLGVVLERKGLEREAVEAYAKAIQLEPGDAKIHFNLALALCKEGSLDQGIAEFKEALRLKPDYSEAKRGLDLAFTAKRSQGTQTAPAK